MPTVRELKKQKFSPPVQQEYRALRDRVFQYLRNHIAGYENKQRQLKKFVKANYSKPELRFVVVATNREAISNAKMLSHLYKVVCFLRTGKSTDDTEKFFNHHFHNREFRNDFWTYWNKRHNRNERD